MADQTLEPFCVRMDVKCGTGHCGAMAREKLARWGCACVESVENGGDEIRQYGGLLYTRWLGGAFVEYVDVAEGEAAFAGGAVTKKRGEGDVPFFTQYYQTKEVHTKMAGGDSGNVTYMDYSDTALRINHYVDYYNNGGQWWAYCNSKDEVQKRIKEELKRSPTYFAENPRWDSLWNDIEAKYEKHKKELDDLEYNYLDGQRTGLEAQIQKDEDQVKKELLTAVQKKVKARMETMRPTPTPTKKNGGMFGWLSTSGKQQSTTDVRVLLDELRQLNAV
jgi:hypothetical protein